MMSRFYKIHLMPNVPKQRYDIFMINPSMNTFDSFMIEICSRLPELFYQPFKLLYRDSTGDTISIFNWLDFGIFFQQDILSVYILKCDSLTDANFRTIWSMPMPTAKTLSTYEQLTTQPAFQLAQPSHYPLFKGMEEKDQPNNFMNTNKSTNNLVISENYIKTPASISQKNTNLPTKNMTGLNVENIEYSTTNSNLNQDLIEIMSIDFTANTESCEKSKETLDKREVKMDDPSGTENGVEEKPIADPPVTTSEDLIKALEKPQRQSTSSPPKTVKEKKKKSSKNLICDLMGQATLVSEYGTNECLSTEPIARETEILAEISKILCEVVNDDQPIATEINKMPSIECTEENVTNQVDKSTLPDVEPMNGHCQVDAVVDVKIDNIYDSLKLIGIEGTLRNCELESVQTVSSRTSSEEGQVSPNFSWTFIETADVADECFGVMDLPKSTSPGAIPKLVTKKQRKITKRTLPQIPNIVDKPEYFDSLSDPDFRANEALKAMLAMGFSNHDGQLTELLKNVNGNISNALDILQD